MRLFSRKRRRIESSGPPMEWVRAMDVRPDMLLGGIVPVVKVRVGEGDLVNPQAHSVDRSAGRYCTFCDRHGSHHSDAHDDFMQVELTLRPTPNAPEYNVYLSGTELVQVTG